MATTTTTKGQLKGASQFPRSEVWNWDRRRININGCLWVALNGMATCRFLCKNLFHSPALELVMLPSLNLSITNCMQWSDHRDVQQIH